MNLAFAQSVSMTAFEQLRFATEIIRHEASALATLAKNIPDDFHEAAELLCRCEGSVIVLAWAKPVGLAKKFRLRWRQREPAAIFCTPPKRSTEIWGASENMTSYWRFPTAAKRQKSCTCFQPFANSTSR